MRDDSKLTKRERQAGAATVSRVEPEDLSRFEGEGGRRVPEQPNEDEPIINRTGNILSMIKKRRSMKVTCERSQVASHSPLAGEEFRMPPS